MARHVILGGGGFIGRHVALMLLRRGERVVLCGRTPPPEPPADVADMPVAFEPIDLASARWESLLHDGDVVHHYAWSTIPKTANDSPLTDLDVNLRGTVRLLEALRRRQGTRLVFASSGGTVYGPPRRLPIAETHPLEPVTAYGVSKVAAEKYLGFYRSVHGLDCRIARIANPFGVGQDPHRRQGAASIFLARALAGEPIEVWGDGRVVRDYIHVADVASGLLAIVDAAFRAGSDMPVFNIGTGEGVSIARLLTVIEQQVGRKIDICYRTGRSFDVAANVLDITHIGRTLGWRPRLNCWSGIDVTIRDHAAGASSYSTLLDRKDGTPATGRTTAPRTPRGTCVTA